MPLITTETRTQLVCTPVGDEFGTPPDPELMRGAFRPIVDEVANQAAATHALTAAELETGVDAERALKSLGCIACGAAEICEVRQVLEQKVVEGQKNRSVLDKMAMLVSAPTWLTAARLNKSDISFDRLLELENNPAEVQQAMQQGELDLDKLVGKATNEFEGLYKKADIPELSNIPSLDPKADLPSHVITTAEGHRYAVIDASHALPFKDDSQTLENYSILAEKFLDRLAADNNSGKPQILTADKTMQKVIRSYGSAKMFEIRKGGKSRLYFTLQENPGNDLTARIVILGSHGDNEQVQKRFIAMAS